MTVITMTREMGSLGRDVALRLAGRLGLELVQHEADSGVDREARAHGHPRARAVRPAAQ